MGENKRAHLLMIQNLVDRLSQNSFLIKGWSISIVAAMFALSAQNTNLVFIYLAYFPSIIFWILDSYFLRQEKLYRALYNYVRTMGEEKIDFSLDAAAFSDDVPSWGHILGSKTLLAFHGSIILSILIVMIIALFIS